MTTIHYRLRCETDDPQQVRELISQLHQRAHELAFERVEGIIELEGDACDYRHDDQSPHGWLLVQSRRHVTDPLEPARHFGVIPRHMIAFAISPGPGCESANFGLCRYPEFIEACGRRIETRLPAWGWGSFCKTRCAGNPEHGGRDNFRRCHLAIVELLRHTQQLGILETVHDEAGLWDNWQVIAQALGLVRAA